MYFEKKGEYKMKKNKLTVGLVTSFIGALALTSCSSTPAVTPKDNSLVELVGYNGETDTIEVKTDDMYGKYSDSNDGTKLYYNAILEALIRYEYPKISEEAGSNLKKFKTLLEEAQRNVDSSKRTAEENATNNGTTFAEEWDKILESHDCESEEDLKQYYLYDLEKTELTDKYFKANEDTLKDQYIGVDKSWQQVDEFEEANSLYPYHILHILVSLDASESDYVRGTISQSNAKKLWTVVRKLIDQKYSFPKIASTDSDDTGSKPKFGDVGIMNTKTSFYNEFKLGIYAYDAILSGINANVSEGDHKNNLIYKAFGLSDDATVVTETTSTKIVEKKVVDLVKSEMMSNVITPIANGKIPTVPYQIFQLMDEKSELEKIDGVAIEANDAALPRNVLYNQFLNFHSPFVITDEDLVVPEFKKEGEFSVKSHDFKDKTEGNLAIDKTNFVEMSIGGVTKNILCDADGNVVIGVRSSAGIHFMVMRKSVFFETNKQAGKESTTLADYYTTAIPSDEDYPSAGQTYVNMTETDDDTYYKERANEIKNAVKSSDFDAAYDYRVYEELFAYAGDSIKFFDEDAQGNSVIKSNIEKYIELLRETSKESNETSIKDAWQTYLLMLRYQNSVRKMDNAMVPATCAFNFKTGAEYKEGGYCYVK